MQTTTQNRRKINGSPFQPGKSTGRRYAKPPERSDKSKKNESACGFIASVALKNRGHLEITRTLGHSESIPRDYEGILTSLAQKFPDIEVSGNNPATVLTEVINAIQAMILKEHGDDAGFEIVQTLMGYDVNAYIPYTNSDHNMSICIDWLLQINTRYPSYMPYVMTVIKHLYNVSEISTPDAQQGWEARVIEFFQDCMVNEPGEVDKKGQKYYEGLFRKHEEWYPKKEALLYGKSLVFGYPQYKKLRPKDQAQRDLFEALQIGEEILKCREQFQDFVCNPNHIGADDSNEEPEQLTRFYRIYNSFNDEVWQNMMEEMDERIGNGGMLPLFAAVPYEPGQPVKLPQFPILLHNFFEKICWVTDHIQKEKEKNKKNK